MLLELLENLKDGDVNPKNVLKNQINFKSDLIRIKRENPRFKSEWRIRATQHIEKFFHWGEIVFLKDYCLLLSEAKYKTKHAEGLKD